MCRASANVRGSQPCSVINSYGSIQSTDVLGTCRTCDSYHVVTQLRRRHAGGDVYKHMWQNIPVWPLIFAWFYFVQLFTLGTLWQVICVRHSLWHIFFVWLGESVLFCILLAWFGNYEIQPWKGIFLAGFMLFGNEIQIFKKNYQNTIGTSTSHCTFLLLHVSLCTFKLNVYMWARNFFTDIQNYFPREMSSGKVDWLWPWVIPAPRTQHNYIHRKNVHYPPFPSRSLVRFNALIW